MLMAALEKANAGQGPGFTLLGVVVRPSMIWGLAGGMASVIAGAGLSAVQEMDTRP